MEDSSSIRIKGINTAISFLCIWQKVHILCQILVLAFPVNRTLDLGIASVMHNHIMQQKMSIDNKEYLHNLHKNT